MDEIEEVLFDLVTDGEVMAKCPLCLIPLDLTELYYAQCSTCGKLDPQKITYHPVENNPSC